jgi:chromosome segregation ATPase
MADLDDTTSSDTTSDTELLETGDVSPALPAGEETQALPEGYEILVDSPETLDQETHAAEEFGETLVAVQNMVLRYSHQLDELNEKMKHIRESLSNLMDNDNELQELEQKAKTLTTDVKQRKQRVKESPEAVQLQMKANEYKEEKSEIMQTLSNHLLRYFQMTGSRVIEDQDGTEREFSISARMKGAKKGGEE